MRARAIAAAAIVLGLTLTGCTGDPAPKPEPTKSSSPAKPAPTPAPTPSPSPSPSIPAPRLTTPPVEPIVDEAPDHAVEITRVDAYGLCKVKALADFPGPADTRNSYSPLDGSYVEAVDGWWRVWIPGVEYVDGAPTNVAITCALNGYIDNPTWWGWGGVASDYYPSIDAYFAEFLQPYVD